MKLHLVRLALLAVIAGSLEVRAADTPPPGGITFTASTNAPVQRRLRRTYERRVDLRGEGDPAVQPPPRAEEQRKPGVREAAGELSLPGDNKTLGSTTDRRPPTPVARPSPRRKPSEEGDVWLLDSIEKIMGGGKETEEKAAEGEPSNWLVNSVAQAAGGGDAKAKPPDKQQPEQDPTGRGGLIGLPGEENAARFNEPADHSRPRPEETQRTAQDDPNTPEDESKARPYMREEDFRNTAGNFSYTNSPVFRDLSRDMMAEKEAAMAGTATNAPVALDSIAAMAGSIGLAPEDPSDQKGGLMKTADLIADVFGVDKAFRPTAGIDDRGRITPPPVAPGMGLSDLAGSVRAGGGASQPFENSGFSSRLGAGSSALNGNPSLNSGLSGAPPARPSLPSSPRPDFGTRPMFTAPSFPMPAPPQLSPPPARPARPAPDVVPGILPSMR